MSSRVLFSHHTWHCKCTRDDKINDCGFKFSVACEWSVLIKDKDNLLQFAKVFPQQILKLLIHQSFTPLLFCAIQYNKQHIDNIPYCVIIGRGKY